MEARDIAANGGGVAAYLRVSADVQRLQGTIENQRAAIERYIAVDGVQRYGTYEDEAVSGYYVPFEQRPDGKRLLADVQAGHVSLIVVTKLDRLGRNAFEILRAVRQIEAAGARLISLKENVDTSTSAGRFFLTVLAGVAELERDSILERADAGLQRRLGENAYMGGPPLYGYRVEGKRREARLVIDDTLDEASGYSEADVVHLCWHLLVEEDWTSHQIAARLMELHIPTRKGGVWSNVAVCSMLSNMAYAGTHKYRRKDGTIHAHALPAILTVEQVEQARATLARHRITARTRATGEDDVYLLRGKLRCNECGQLYTTTASRGHGGKAALRRYYVCSTRDFNSNAWHRLHPEKFPQSCIGKSVDALSAELQVWAQIYAWIQNPSDALRDLAAQRQVQTDEADSARDELERKQKERDALQDERNKLLTLYRKGVMTETDVTHQLNALSDEDAKLRDKIDALAETLREAMEESEGLERARTHLQQLHARLESEPFTLALQRDTINDLVKEIRVLTLENGISYRGNQKYRAKLEVTYKFKRPVPADAQQDVNNIVTLGRS